MAEHWTDERLDDFRADVDRRFDRVDCELRAQRAEMKAGFERMDERFERMDERFERLHHLLVQVAISLLVAGAALFAAQL